MLKDICLLDTRATGRNPMAQMLRASEAPHQKAIRRLDIELEQRCPDLWRSLVAGRAIILSVVCEPVELPALRAWQACLILSELVSEAVRRGFSRRADGTLRIEVRQLAGHVVCVFSDDGDARGQATDGQTAHVVEMLAAELEAVVHREQGPGGSTILLTFPIADASHHSRTSDRYRHQL